MRYIVLGTLCTVALGLVSSGCVYEITATANRVPVPVLVGPVEQIGQGGPGPDEPGATFDSKIDRVFTAASSSSTHGDVTITKTTASYQQVGAGKVDADVRVAAGGATDRLVRIDKLRVNAYSGFFYSAAWISSRVRLKGHVGRKIPSMRDAVVAEPTPEPAEPVEAVPTDPEPATEPVVEPKTEPEPPPKPEPEPAPKPAPKPDANTVRDPFGGQ